MSLRGIGCQPLFLNGAQGRLFALSYHPPQLLTRRHGVLIVPPFAEEMNKSRRMLSQQARLLAGEGYLTLLPDLYGTGESDGEFSDASWTGWCEDLVCGYRWLRERGVDTVSVLAQRTGALLVTALVREKSVTLNRLVLWQPVVSGDMFLTQFLRLRLAAEMAKGVAERSSVAQIRAELENKGTIEVAGYTLSQHLALPLGDSRMEFPADCFAGELHWCELVATADRAVTVVTQRALDALQAGGVQCELHKVVGHPFWGATEIEDLPLLLDTTRRIFSQ